MTKNRSCVGGRGGGIGGFYFWVDRFIMLLAEVLRPTRDSNEISYESAYTEEFKSICLS